MPQSSLLTRPDAIHFLRRAGFGGTSAEIDSYVGLTRLQAVDRAMNFSSAPRVARPFATSEDWWISHRKAHGWWIDRMVTTPTPLQEKLTLFWHSHFAVGARKVAHMDTVWDHVQMLRAGSLGSFQSLVQQSSVSPAMLVYLDNQSNVVGSQQENFARELMELHTIGVGNFTESDVISMARAWTGYNTRQTHEHNHDISYFYADFAHDHGLKTLFGTTKDWSGPQAIDELCFGAGRLPNAQRITRKLWRFLVRTDPTTAVLDPIAGSFASSDLDIATLVRSILLHDEFWAPTSHSALVKSPVEFIVDVMRRFGLRVDETGKGDNGKWLGGGDVFYLMGFTGQQLFEPPNVNGWGVGSTWLSTATMWARARALSSIRWRANRLNVFGDPNSTSALRFMSPAAGVQRIFDQMGIDSPSAATRSRLQSWFTTLQQGDDWAIHPNAVMVGGLCPEFQLT